MRTILAALLLWPSLAAAAWWPLPFGGPSLDAQRKLFEGGRYAEVITALTPDLLLKLRRSELQRAYVYLGASYERTGQLDKALGVYQLGIKLFPKNVELLTRLAQLLHASLLEEQALPIYHKILDLQPLNTPAHVGLAEIDRSLGFLDRSAEHYERALEDLEDNPALWRDYTEVLIEMREWKTAGMAIQKALELSPENADARVTLAFVQRGQGDITSAIETISGAISGAGDPVPLELRQTRALWLLEAGREPAAGLEADAILKQAPGQPLALFVRARVHLKEGRRAQAVKDLEAAAAGGARFVAQVSRELLRGLQAGR